MVILLLNAEKELSRLQNHKLSIRDALPDDAALLSHVSGVLFHQAYQGLLESEDLEKYVSENLNPGEKSDELKDPNIKTFLAEINGKVVGYAQIRQKKAPIETASQKGVELWRIYLDKSCHGHGHGRELLHHAIDGARDFTADSIWLGVWEQNQKAIQFYQKMGFNVVGSQQFDVGSEVQNDLVMMASIGNL